MAKHEILRSRPGTISGILPAVAALVGTPFMVSAVDADTGARTFALADGKCDGFVSREVRVGSGPTVEEQVFGFGLETPFEAGKEGSLELAHEVVVEGSDYLDATIVTGITAGTKLSFSSGKFKAATTGQLAQWEVVAELTPETAGNVRLHVKAIEGYLVP